MAAFSKLLTAVLPLYLLALVGAGPTGIGESDYAPRVAGCPSTPLLRPATGLGDAETEYISQRKAVADVALKDWLQGVSPEFDCSSLPKIALTASGGGFRATLCGAGVIKAFDARDSDSAVAGIYQAVTYQAGLSGGGWLVESMAGNNYPTISSLVEYWTPFLENPVIALAFSWNNPILLKTINDLIAKARAGFQLDFVDPWGRLLSNILFFGADGAVSQTLSGVTELSNYTSYKAPFPIVTCLSLDAEAGQCVAPAGALQFEFTPYEFGSWDEGVATFSQTKYLGTTLSDGQPKEGDTCIEGFDNIGYVLGTSSNLFNSPGCGVTASNGTGPIELMQQLLEATKTKIVEDAGFSNLINPFYNNAASTKVSSQQFLNLVDGGEFDVIQNGQGDPLWPLIHKERAIDVIIISDASGDTDDGWPNGNALRQTALQSQMQGVGGMPDIPSADVIVGQGLNKRPTFFGCKNNETPTLIWLPNSDYVFASNTSTYQFSYSPDQTAGMVENSVQVASKGGDQQWATCLACGLMAKEGGKLPDACGDCLEQYCYN